MKKRKYKMSGVVMSMCLQKLISIRFHFQARRTGAAGPRRLCVLREKDVMF